MAPFFPAYLWLLPPCQAITGDLLHLQSVSIYGSARDSQQRCCHPLPLVSWEIALEIEPCQELLCIKWSSVNPICTHAGPDPKWDERLLLLLTFTGEVGSQCMLPCKLWHTFGNALLQLECVKYLQLSPRIGGNFCSLNFSAGRTTVWHCLVILGLVEDLSIDLGF